MTDLSCLHPLLLATGIADLAFVALHQYRPSLAIPHSVVNAANPCSPAYISDAHLQFSELRYGCIYDRVRDTLLCPALLIQHAWGAVLIS
jgi:hypothetical protein